MVSRITRKDIIDITNLSENQIIRLWSDLSNEERAFLLSKFLSIPEGVMNCNKFAVVCWTPYQIAQTLKFIDYSGLGATYSVDDVCVTVTLPQATTSTPVVRAGFKFDLLRRTKRAYILATVEFDDTAIVDFDFATTTADSYANPPNFYICPRIASVLKNDFQILKNVSGTETQIDYESVALSSATQYKVEGYVSTSGLLVASRDDVVRLRDEYSDSNITWLNALRITGHHDDTTASHTFKIYPPLIMLYQ